VTPLPIAEPGEEGWLLSSGGVSLRRLAGGCSRPLTLTDLAYKFIGGMSGSTWITDCFCNGLDFP
jgi:hypothetical protein